MTRSKCLRSVIACTGWDSCTKGSVSYTHLNNPLLAESLYLARYIEKAGSGTERMIELCREAGLPEPTFELRAGSFIVTLWRDWLTDDILADLHLNDRQQRAVAYVRKHRTLSNAVYQTEFEASKRTASRDLDGLVAKGILEKIGTTGKGVLYQFGKGAAKEPKGP